MVVLVGRLSKIYFKLENHLHHHHHEAATEALLQASLEAFRSDVSVALNRLLLSNSKPGSELLSFAWIQLCFELLQVINKAFAKVVVDIDYPMSKWEASSSVEEYLNYSLCLMELLNSISSSMSHLRQARLSLSHALSLVENSPPMAIERLRAFPTKSNSSCKEFKRPENNKEDGDGGDRFFGSNKERAVNEALMEVKSIGFWACGVILAGLSGDAKAYVDMRNSGGGFSNSALSSLDSSICEMMLEKKGGVLKEVRELNDSANCLAAALETGESGNQKAAEELQRRLEAFEKVLDNMGSEVDHLFSKLLAGRNQLVDGIRRNSKIA
ncbi:hypothetical protein ACOSP7_018881 [Xanthoceras sorbifolium]|uniref:Protein BPS1, chloroplastic-like n=1 Tax=Xanthoceras sorbifolium TaxID=99658 RepID=A0ABQ8I1W1_9ROSI|nr:hypothetical protein JRO89_XS05G0142600 [Xanthoceras sorbifolium]